MSKYNQPIRLENDEGQFIVSGNKLLLIQDADAKSMSPTDMDLQKMKDALASVVPLHKKVIPTSEPTPKPEKEEELMKCTSLDDERRQKICQALFYQIDTAKLEKIAVDLGVISL